MISWFDARMPQPGPSFVAEAERRALAGGASREEWIPRLYDQALVSVGTLNLRVPLGATTIPVRFLSGQVWADNKSIGPPESPPSKIVVIGKQPGQEEESSRANFVGPSGEYLRLLTCYL